MEPSNIIKSFKPVSLNCEKLKTLIENANNIPNDLNNATILLGNTGSGKSVLLNALLGKQLRGFPKDYEIAVELDPSEKKDECPTIGNSHISETGAPEIWPSLDGTMYIDTPGFADNKSIEQQIANAILVKKLFQKIHTGNFLIVIPHTQFDLKNKRGNDILDFIGMLTDIFPEIENMEDCFRVVVTKVEDIYRQGKLLEEVSEQYYEKFMQNLKSEHEKEKTGVYFQTQKYRMLTETLFSSNKIALFRSPTEDSQKVILSQVFWKRIKSMKFTNIDCTKVKVPLSKEAEQKIHSFFKENIDYFKDLQTKIEISIPNFVKNKSFKDINKPVQELNFLIGIKKLEFGGPLTEFLDSFSRMLDKLELVIFEKEKGKTLKFLAQTYSLFSEIQDPEKTLEELLYRIAFKIKKTLDASVFERKDKLKKTIETSFRNISLAISSNSLPHINDASKLQTIYENLKKILDSPTCDFLTNITLFFYTHSEEYALGIDTLISEVLHLIDDAKEVFGKEGSKDEDESIQNFKTPVFYLKNDFRKRAGEVSKELKKMNEEKEQKERISKKIKWLKHLKNLENRKLQICEAHFNVPHFEIKGIRLKFNEILQVKNEADPTWNTRLDVPLMVVFATISIELSSKLDWKGGSLIFVAPKIKINKEQLPDWDLSGEDGKNEYDSLTAEDGYWVYSSGGGTDGKNGANGKSGSPGGNITIVANQIEFMDAMKIKVEGGNGRDGQNGGSGGSCKEKYFFWPSNKDGGNGGNGGKAGLGGLPGNIWIYEETKIIDMKNQKFLKYKGKNGKPGGKGYGGKPWYGVINGKSGKDGMDGGGFVEPIERDETFDTQCQLEYVMDLYRDFMGNYRDAIDFPGEFEEIVGKNLLIDL